jgi:hypothetical protein
MKGSVRLFVCIVLLLVVAAKTPVHAQGSTFFVATTGSDSNPGSASAPWRTIQFATSQLSAGATLNIRGGTYNEAIVITSSNASGTSFSNAITVTAYNNETVNVNKISVTGARRYWIFNGLTVHNTSINDDTINVGGGETPGAGSGFIKFTNVEVIGYTGPLSSTGSCVQFSVGSQGSNQFIGGKVHNCDWPAPPQRNASHGFYISSPNNLIQGTEIYNYAQYAFHIYSGNNNNTTVNGNYIHDGGTSSYLSGPMLISGNSNLVMNNIFANNANGIIFFDYGGTPTGNRAYNNSVYRSGNGNVACGSNCYPAIYVGMSQVNADVRNNIVFGNLISSVGNSGSGTGLGTNMASDPGYLNAPGGNFRLGATSPAIDVGTALSVVTVDFAGVSRPQGAGYDIGAFEYVAMTKPRSPQDVHVVR